MAQPLVLTLMALCPQNVSRLRIGKLSPAAIATLRLLRDFLGCTFKLAPQAAGGGEAGSGGASASASAGSSAGGSRKKRAREEEQEGGEAGAGGRGSSGQGTVIVSCLGVGFKNNAKRVT